MPLFRIERHHSFVVEADVFSEAEAYVLNNEGSLISNDRGTHETHSITIIRSAGEVSGSLAEKEPANGHSDHPLESYF